MSFFRIRRYLDTLHAHHKCIAALLGPINADSVMEVLGFLDEGEKLNPAAIAATIGLPHNLQKRWVSRLDELNKAHRQLITAVTCPLPEKRLQYEYGLLVLVEVAQRELDSLERELRKRDAGQRARGDAAETVAAETISNPTNVSDQSDLVTADADAVRGVLDWIEALNQERRDTPRVVTGALHAYVLRPKARAVTLARVRDQLRQFAELLREEQYKCVVSASVVEWTAPMLEEAAEASEELAGDADRGKLSDPALDRWIGALKAAWPELRKLTQLLAARFEQIRRKARKTDKPADVMQPVSDDPGEVKPIKYLKNWSEILDCLDQKNNDGNRRHVAKMNRQYDGPIKLPTRGGQPKVEKTKLVDWWNRLEIQWETQGSGLNTEANIDAQYNHGKNETVVPEISGHVKKKRRRVK